MTSARGSSAALGVKGTFYRAPNGFYFGGGSLVYVMRSPTITCTSGRARTEARTLTPRSKYRDTDYAVTADLHAGWHIADTGLTPYLGVEYRYEQEYLYAYKLRRC